VKGRRVAWDKEVDCLGLLCPLPVLRARRVLAGMRAGEVLRLLASDKMAAIDLPHFCAQAGHVFLGQSEVEGGTAYLIRCADEALSDQTG
jgi:tRNA 2-thiouridine synthesizing protein A